MVPPAPFQPARPLLARARAIVRASGARTGRAAWQALAKAGLVDLTASRTWSVEYAGRGGSCHAPERPWQAVLLASDPEGLAVAERAGLQAARGLRRWGVPSPAGVIWTFVRPRAWRFRFEQAERARKELGGRGDAWGRPASHVCAVHRQARALPRARPRDRAPFVAMGHVWDAGYAVSGVLVSGEASYVLLAIPYGPGELR